MTTSHAATIGPVNLHPARTPRLQRTVLLVMYTALAAQLAIWSTLAARAGLTAAFTQAHPGAAADVVAGGAVWLAQFTAAVALATIRYRRYHR
jgi:hypothetical protein